MRVNIALEVEKLKSSDVISHALNDRTIRLVGAQYDLQTGVVSILIH